LEKACSWFWFWGFHQICKNKEKIFMR
jgi:hypothetical protein